jgi:iron complex outermembrane receptor protein
VNSGPAVLRDDPQRSVAVARLSLSTLRTGPAGPRSAYAYLLAIGDDFRRPIGFGDEQDDSITLGLGGSVGGVMRTRAGNHRWHLRLQGDALWNNNAFFHNDRGHRGARFSRNALRALGLVATASDEWRPDEAWSLVTAVQARLSTRHSTERHGADVRPTLQVGPVPSSAGGPLLPPTYPASDTSFAWRAATILPRAAVQWRPRSGWLVHAGASFASEAPTLSDFFVLSGGSPNAGPTRFTAQPLRSQRAATVESGVRAGGRAWSLEATAYHSRLRHELLAYDQDGAEVTMNARTPTVHRGIEATFAARLGRGWWHPADETTLQVAWTRNDFRFRSDPEYGNNRIAGQPRETVGAVLSHRSGDRGGAELSIQWQPQATDIDHANARAYGGFNRVDLRLHRRIAPGWTAFAEVRNLSGTRSPVSSLVVRRVASDLQATLFPGNPRHLVAGLSWAR